MTYQQERDQFVADAAAAGMALSDARLFMRYATTSHRLAEASCNGDWPADNGERKTKECTTCGSHWAPSFIRKDGLCGDCALDNRIKALAAQYPQFELEQQGDPRGRPDQTALSEARVPQHVVSADEGSMSVETYWVIGWLGNHADSTYPRLPKLYYIYTDRGGPPFTVYWTDNRAGATLFNMTQRSTVALPQGGYWSQVPGVTP